MNKISVGNKIKKLRISKGLTQFKLAELVDMHEKHISRIESGKYLPNIDNLITIFKVLGCDINDVLAEKDIKLKENPDKIKILKIINSATQKELKYYLGILEQVKKGLKELKR